MRKTFQFTYGVRNEINCLQLIFAKFLNELFLKQVKVWTISHLTDSKDYLSLNFIKLRKFAPELKFEGLKKTLFFTIKLELLSR